MIPKNSDGKDTAELKDVIKYLNPKTGNLNIPRKEKDDVFILVLRKIYGWYNNSVKQKINIYSSKILSSYFKYIEEQMNQVKNLVSGFILNPLFEFPEILNVFPINIISS